MRDLLSPDRLRSDGIFAVDAVEALVAEHVSRRHNHSHLLWALMVFHDWKRRWI
jgi:asparagine synthase (glutamine-hydrolysing)